MGDQNLLSTSASRVQLALHDLGPPITVRQVSASTRTAEDAAAVIGCAVGQIVKSLVFRGCDTGKACLFLVSGTNHVDEDKCSSSAGEKIERARPEFVREQTGFAIGGVPPLGHPVHS